MNEDHEGLHLLYSQFRTLEGIGILLAVDRILDMFRTTVNVISDSCGALVIACLEGEDFSESNETVSNGLS